MADGGDSATGFSPPATVTSTSGTDTSTLSSLSSIASPSEPPTKAARVLQSRSVPALPGRAGSQAHTSRETGSQRRLEGLNEASSSEESSSSTIEVVVRRQEIERKKQQLLELQEKKLESEIRESELELQSKLSSGASQRSRGSRKERRKANDSPAPPTTPKAGMVAKMTASYERASSSTRPKSRAMRTPSPRTPAQPGLVPLQEYMKGLTPQQSDSGSVSYTHLTLPTILLV